MPRGFTDTEYDFYRTRFLEVGERLFSTNGLNKVSIDQLVKEVGVAKGSFYKFFKNKEDLCFDVLMKLESDIRSGIIDNLKQYKKRPGTLMKELIKETVRVISDYPIIAIFQDQAQMQQLMLRVPSEKMENNFNGDMLAVNELFNGTDILTKRSAEDITAFIWLIVFMTLNRDSYNGYFNNVIDLISDMTEKYFKSEV